MKKQTVKWGVLLAIGLFCNSVGLTLNHFGVIGDETLGFIHGIGIGLEITALFKAKNYRRCERQMS